MTHPAGPSTERAAGPGTAFTLLAALGFAAVSTLTSIAVAHGTALPNVLMWRYVLSSVVLVLWVGARGYPRMPARPLLQFLIIGGGGQALLVGLALSSIAYIPVATLAFLFYTYPAWVTLVQAVRGAERVTPRRAVALLLSFSGVVVVAGSPFGAASVAPGYWTGVGLALGAAIVYGAYIPTMQVLQRDHPIAVTSALAKIGSAACFLMWSVGKGTFNWQLPGASWGAIAALTIFSTVLPSVFFLMGLVRLGAVRTAIVSTIEPFLTALLGAVVLGQAVSPRAAIGGAMIVAAVVVLQWRRERVA